MVAHCDLFGGEFIFLSPIKIENTASHLSRGHIAYVNSAPFPARTCMPQPGTSTMGNSSKTGYLMLARCLKLSLFLAKFLVPFVLNM